MFFLSGCQVAFTSGVKRYQFLIPLSVPVTFYVISKKIFQYK